MRGPPPRAGFSNRRPVRPEFLEELPAYRQKEKSERRVGEMVQDARSESESAFQYEEHPREHDVVFSVSGPPAVVMVERVSETERDAERNGEPLVGAVIHSRHREHAEQEKRGDEGVPDLSELIIRPRSPSGSDRHENENAEDGDFSEEYGIHWKNVFYVAIIRAFYQSGSLARIDNPPQV